MRSYLACSQMVLLAVIAAACGATREDDVTAECVSDPECDADAICESGRCVTIEGANVIGQIAGAPKGILVEVRDAEDCEEREDRGVVCAVEAGGGLTLIAPAVEGHRFKNWSGGNGCSGEEPEITLKGVKKNVICTANYARRVRVSGEVAGEGGAAVLASSEGAFATCEAGFCEVDAGETVVLLAPARDGFRIESFEGEGCGERDGYRVTVSTGESDVLCTASYVPSLTVRGQTQGLGEVANTPAGEVLASSPWEGAQCDGPLCAIDPGNTVALRAPEVEGFRFRGWTGDPACLGSELEITLEGVNSNLTCTADYVARHTVRGESEGAEAEISASSENLFSACEGPGCVVDSGESVTLIAGTVDGYRLSEWSGEGCEALPGASAIAREVSGDVTCIAHYVEGVSVSGTLVNVEGEVEALSDSPRADCGRGACAIDLGGTVTLNAPDVPGRTFQGWTGDEGCESDQLSITLEDVRRSKSCRATYAARYTVHGNAMPTEGGTVSATSRGPNEACRGARCEVDEGSAVTLEAKVASSYRFTGWSGGGPCLGFGPRLDLIDVRSTVTCTANFVLRIDVSGVASPAEAATVSASQLSLSAECAGNRCTVDAPSDVTLTANAREGWRFVNWSGCGSPFNPLLALNPLPVLGPTEDTECTANFERMTYPVAAIGTEGGTVSATQGGFFGCLGNVCQVPHGEGATLSAVPNAGYDFSGWDGVGCDGGATLQFSDVTGPITCTAIFTAKPEYTLMGVTNLRGAPQPVASAPGFPCSGASCTVYEGSTVSLTASSNTDYRFVRWEGCFGGIVGGFSGEVITFALGGNTTCTAVYVQRFQVISSTASGLGDTNCPDAAGCYGDEGGLFTVTATAAPGWHFVRWEGCTNSTSAIATFTVTSLMTCKAHFEEDVQYWQVITSTQEGDGITNCAPPINCQGVEGQPYTIQAIPGPGEYFDHWEGCTNSKSATVDIIVTSLMTCRAVFYDIPLL